jgi:hypothetical protein
MIYLYLKKYSEENLKNNQRNQVNQVNQGFRQVIRT